MILCNHILTPDVLYKYIYMYIYIKNIPYMRFQLSTPSANVKDTMHKITDGFLSLSAKEINFYLILICVFN